MIKVMINKTGFIDKLNIVDDKDSFIGFEMESSCCEWFGVFLALEDIRSYQDLGHMAEGAGILSAVTRDMCDQEHIDHMNAELEKLSAPWLVPRAITLGEIPGGDEGRMLTVGICETGLSATIQSQNARGYRTPQFILFNEHNGYYGHGVEFGKDVEPAETYINSYL